MKTEEISGTGRADHWRRPPARPTARSAVRKDRHRAVLPAGGVLVVISLESPLVRAVLAWRSSRGYPRRAFAEGSDTPLKRDKVSILLNWFPEAEHGGFYAALVSGEYERRGARRSRSSRAASTSRSRRGWPGARSISASPTPIRWRSPATPGRRSSPSWRRCRRARAASWCTPARESASLADLNDMTLAISPKDAFAEFVQKHYPLRNVKIVPYPGSVAPFLNDRALRPAGLQHQRAVRGPEGGRRSAGADAGRRRLQPVHQLPGDPRRVWRARTPTWCAAWCRPACAAGSSTCGIPRRPTQRILELNPEMGPEILQFGVDEMQAMTWLDPVKKSGIGDMTLARWSAFVDTMVALKLVTKERVKPAECFTRVFLGGASGIGPAADRVSAGLGRSRSAGLYITWLGPAGLLRSPALPLPLPPLRRDSRAFQSPPPPTLPSGTPRKRRSRSIDAPISLFGRRGAGGDADGERPGREPALFHQRCALARAACAGSSAR